MPFIKPEQRKKVEETGTWEQPGDLCYMKYKPMMEKWREKRSWTAFHNMTKDLFDIDDEKTAKLLAFLVFFSREVMRYENEKVEENGDV
jgi:hypothetical protein